MVENVIQNIPLTKLAKEYANNTTIRLEMFIFDWDIRHSQNAYDMCGFHVPWVSFCEYLWYPKRTFPPNSLEKKNKTNKNKKMTSIRKKQFVCVLDFEATCEKEPKPPPSPQEVIEFPSVLLVKNDQGRLEEVSTFESFVRPIFHPKLSEFCTSLTSITQDQMDGAEPFPDVLEKHVAWLKSHGVFEPDASIIMVTCGDWDLKKMLPGQLAACRIRYSSIPGCYSRWINVKPIFDKCLKRKSRTGMAGMLDLLGHELTGTHHRGIDDCKNIVKIVKTLNEQYGAEFDVPTGFI